MTIPRATKQRAANTELLATTNLKESATFSTLVAFFNIILAATQSGIEAGGIILRRFITHACDEEPWNILTTEFLENQ